MSVAYGPEDPTPTAFPLKVLVVEDAVGSNHVGVKLTVFCMGVRDQMPDL